MIGSGGTPAPRLPGRHAPQQSTHEVQTGRIHQDRPISGRQAAILPHELGNLIHFGHHIGATHRFGDQASIIQGLSR
ncbi:hypothetical protein I551_3694 [Mycobacterium ulcerans str. Harvey]|uniref:Uncharacterized protein n=1 Tax=Mycobacterium ulcerans str. Harvey TaxID=1299332 RepID=A0ABP3AGA9_MYCUL|nr:hypothetical protein I551_3694 [Mycobacterium ulcerans str. Harvey]